MATSDPSLLRKIVDVLWRRMPGRVLDVGCGFGKVGFLTREYLDVYFHRNYHKHEWTTVVDGVEVWPDFITDVHRHLYDAVHVGDALKVMPGLGRYDVIFILDVIEHLSKEDGRRLLDMARRHGRHVVVSTPASHIDQGAILGKAYGMDVDWGIRDVSYPNLEVVHHDATEPWTMFNDGSLDGVFCISTFEHIFPTQKAMTVLSEARRVVKPDGYVAVTFDVPDVSVRWFEMAIATCGLEYIGEVEREEPVDVLVQSQVIPTWPPHPRPGPQGPERRRTTFAAILRPSP